MSATPELARNGELGGWKRGLLDWIEYAGEDDVLEDVDELEARGVKVVVPYKIIVTYIYDFYE